jgi:hypothetical protein
VNIILYLLSVATMFVIAVRRPTSAQCPHEMWLRDGVRTTGEFACTYRPVGGDHWNGRAWVDDSRVTPGEFRSKVYCDRGAVPVVYDGAAVTCQANP